MSYECPYCKGKFSAKKHVNRHIKTSKYCLDIQRSLELNLAEELEYRCECGYKTLLKYNLILHKKKCTIYNNCIQSESEIGETKMNLQTQGDISDNNEIKDTRMEEIKKIQMMKQKIQEWKKYKKRHIKKQKIHLH